MRRVGAIALILSFTALGSGWLLHVHNAAHAAEDVGAIGHDHDPNPIPADSRTCDLHGKLTLPVLSAGFTPVMIALGLFVAFITQLAPARVSAFAQVRLDCRGPPFCLVRSLSK